MLLNKFNREEIATIIRIIYSNSTIVIQDIANIGILATIEKSMTHDFLKSGYIFALCLVNDRKP